MRTLPVVMINEHLKGSFEVALVRDQHPGQILGTGGPHKAFGDAVRLSRPHWRPKNLHALAAKHVIKGRREFLVTISNQKSQRLRAIGQHAGELASLLSHPHGVRLGRAAGQMHAATAQLDEEQHAEPLQPDRVHRNEVDRDHRSTLGAKELAPGQTCARSGRPEPSLLKTTISSRASYGHRIPSASSVR
jgi:hypothetical protein